MILEKALEAVNSRRASYGDPKNTMDAVAMAFFMLTGIKLKASHIPMIQILLKLERAQNSPGNHDHYVDIAGYSELMFECNKERYGV